MHPHAANWCCEMQASSEKVPSQPKYKYHSHAHTIYLTQTKRWMLGGTTDLPSVIEQPCLLQAVPRDYSF